MNVLNVKMNGKVLMNDFLRQAIVRLKTSIKGNTKTIKDKEYREGFLTGSRLVWDYMHNEVTKYKNKYNHSITEKKLKKKYKVPKKSIINIFPEIDHILNSVSKKLDVSVEQIKSASRLQKFVYARSIAINVMLEKASSSYSFIGRVLGLRNHTSIMYHSKQKNLKIGFWKPKSKIWNIYEEINKEL